MATLDAIVSTAQNVASAINNASQTYQNVQGSQNLADITTTTLVWPQAGRLARVAVLVAGSASGAIYDANDAALTTNQIYVIPMTVGVFEVNFPVSNGIVVKPGTGQKIAVSYSGPLTP